MKILYHHRTRCTGADGAHIEGVIKGFHSLGHSVDLAFPDRLNVKIKREYRYKNISSSQNKNSFNSFPRIIFELMELLYNIPAVLKLITHQTKNNNDIIYERYAFLNFSGCITSIIKKIPFFLEVNFTTKTQVYPKRTKMFEILEKFIEYFVFKHASLIIVISYRLKEDIVSHNVDPKKILVLPNAVDVDKFSPKKPDTSLKNYYGLGSDDRVIGFVGSFYPWHGLDFMLDSFKEILYENDNVKLMLLGGGLLYKSLKKRVHNEGMDRYVIFAGRVSHEILPEYISLFNVGVMPDSNEYGSPMKIFEYMAMEKPVVAPRLSPIQSVINDGREGFLFKRKNKEDLKNVLVRLMNDSVLSKKTGQYGRKKVCQEHTWTKNVEKIVSCYFNKKLKT